MPREFLFRCTERLRDESRTADAAKKAVTSHCIPGAVHAPPSLIRTVALQRFFAGAWEGPASGACRAASSA